MYPSLLDSTRLYWTCRFAKPAYGLPCKAAQKLGPRLDVALVDELRRVSASPCPHFRQPNQYSALRIVDKRCIENQSQACTFNGIIVMFYFFGSDTQPGEYLFGKAAINRYIHCKRCRCPSAYFKTSEHHYRLRSGADGRRF